MRNRDMCGPVITHSALVAAVDELGRTHRIVGPVRVGERFFYREVEDAARIDLRFDYCVYGPRAFLLPPTETLFEFDLTSGGFTARPVLDQRPLVLFGVHPCDVHAIRLLDHVFAVRHPDEHYLARRRKTLIVAIDCRKPCASGVFCKDMHTHEANGGFDVMLYPLTWDCPPSADRYAVAFKTEDGRRWLERNGRCEPPTAEDGRDFATHQAEKTGAFSLALATPVEVLPAILDRSYDSPIWEATARRCYSCGSCNLSCPTCYCFNIVDELNLDLTSGSRKREWDGCQLRGFAEVAGGHNFRANPAARLRHRIYRKAKWVRERTGLAGCVGCARCDRACTAKISSVEIYNQLAEAMP